MRARTKTRRTKTATVTISWGNGSHVVPIPMNAVESVVRYVTTVGAKPLPGGDNIPADEAFADLYKGTSKPATVLRGFRTRDELTQVELAEKLGTSQANVAKMESGERAIGKSMAKRLAEIFRTDYRIFL